jgi:hypothetical protein
MFELVNPYIDGSFETTYDAKTPLDGADMFWNAFSKLIVNHISEFFFTLKDSDDGKLYSFKVSESKSDDGEIKYTIVPIDIELSQKERYAFDENLRKLVKQSGGKRDIFDDSSSSSSSSSSSDLYNDDDIEVIDHAIVKFNKLRIRNRPISYYIYNPSLYKLSSTFIPIFTYPIAPVVKVDFSTALFG